MVSSEQEVFQRGLRDACSECGSAKLDFAPLDALIEFELPRLVGEQLQQARRIIAFFDGQPDVFVWLCQSCGELGGVQTGIKR